MNVISAEEFNKKTSFSPNKSQKIYQDRVLIKGPVFALDKEMVALQYCQSYVKKHSGSYCLVVKEKYYFQLWKEKSVIKNSINKHLESKDNISTNIENISKQKDVIANIEIDKVIEKMRNIGGVKIKNRRYNLRVYPNCFIGTEAVEWMISNLNLSTDQAVQLGQRLIDEKFIHHVLDRHNFQNEYLFYRFYWDEK